MLPHSDCQAPYSFQEFRRFIIIILLLGHLEKQSLVALEMNRLCDFYCLTGKKTIFHQKETQNGKTHARFESKWLVNALLNFCSISLLCEVKWETEIVGS